MKIQLALILLTSLCANCLFDKDMWEVGEVDLRNGGDTIFYYLFRARNSTNRYKKLVVWLTGGPGCSSAIALFTENGPYMFNKAGELYYNEYSWNDQYDLVFVDQPVSVGFSILTDKSHYCKDEVCIARDFHKFITSFYRDQHPEYQNVPLYITGESYAGHYIPAIAAYLLRSKSSHDNEFDIPLKGIAIGNGFTDFTVQVPGYAKFLLENNRVSQFGYLVIQLMSTITVFGLKSPYKFFPNFCFGILDMMSSYAGIKNQYDIRRNDTDADLNHDIVVLLNKPQVNALFGFKEPREYLDVCNDTAEIYLWPDIAVPVSADLEYAMDSDIKVMLYYGNKDYICNWRGGELLADSLNWKGRNNYLKEVYKSFRHNGKDSGQFKKVGNFTFLVVYDSGHMVPMDQKEVALHMIKTFIDGEFN